MKLWLSHFLNLFCPKPTTSDHPTPMCPKPTSSSALYPSPSLPTHPHTQSFFPHLLCAADTRTTADVRLPQMVMSLSRSHGDGEHWSSVLTDTTGKMAWSWRQIKDLLTRVVAQT